MLISAVVTSLLSVLINYKIENTKMHSTEPRWPYLWMRMKQLLSTESFFLEVQHGHKTSYFFVSLSDGDNLLPILRTLAPTQSSSAESGDQWVIFNLSAATKAPQPFWAWENSSDQSFSVPFFNTGLLKLVEGCGSDLLPCFPWPVLLWWWSALTVSCSVTCGDPSARLHWCVVDLTFCLFPPVGSPVPVKLFSSQVLQSQL